MSYPYSVKLYRGFTLLQDFPITFRTPEEAVEFADEIVVGKNEVVYMYINGEKSQPIKMGGEWPR